MISHVVVSIGGLMVISAVHLMILLSKVAKGLTGTVMLGWAF